MEEFKTNSLSKEEELRKNHPAVFELQTLRKADRTAYLARLRAAAKSNGWVRVGGKNYAIVGSDDDGKRVPAGLEVFISFDLLSDGGEYKQLSGFRR